ncbi:signal transduction histidine kinase [Microbacterium endophyticum]|uniref:Signal transduction histidine kinase n=1 Tax=Microbacterium endophyticum TaxID=1526412 RepID=A0A7W4V1N9_9MICO|nr:ATP-binding protein [Microbacterium endophyticum]MBB2975195.1 signal transduction histidine kinase [Microbacterium endophyticum]NIK37593.1 signal transduction histidine kinase [Microbacterium endophyticum]
MSVVEVATAATADIPRIFTAVAEWGACMVFMLLVNRRMRWVGTSMVTLLALLALVAVQMWAGSLPLSLWIFGMLAAAFTMFVIVRVSLEVTATTAGYLAARAFVLAELTASVHWQLERFYLDAAPQVVRTSVMLAVYGSVFALAWWAERRHLPRGIEFEVGVGELVSALAIAVATFGISNLSFVNANTPFSGRVGTEVFYIRTLVDLCGYIALYGQLEVRRSLQARREADAMARLLTSQHDQYEMSRRAIDEVNRKYHDMKHHLEAIRAEQDPQSRLLILNELETSIQNYGASIRTGNSVLDAVLMGKQLYARESGIEMTSVADGRLLNALSPLDVTAIVGNALDNAFEATLRVANAEERLVKFSLFARNDFVMISVENTFDGVVARRDGRIVTRKAGDEHGYGLRNIEAAAERYGGSMSLSSTEQWFSLRILLPRAEVL